MPPLAADIADVPADFIKSALMLFGFVVVIYMQWKNSQTHKREISGEIETRPAHQHADQSDVDALTRTVNTMREEITAQFRAAQQAGEARVSAITQNIDEELRSLAQRIGALAEALHEKINRAMIDNAKQGSDIAHVQNETYRHTQEIAAIRTAIQELLKNGSKTKH
ncbi:hypothetical protein [Prosthecobacter sp.]|uniref:hypothetical protein n=1 Tax=Prosthecobacter sp. TaxID=1965333 RepID=UPI001D66A0F2|nr:hypothetical protein [Prosthecobacter sp.]MCB1279881.1 hypothetical protein [Prosthecobacter sp.]